MRNPTPAVLLAVALLSACATTPPAAVAAPAPVRLLPATAEAETSARTQRREDLDVRTEIGERQPLVVAKSESGPLRLPAGMRAFLAGDAAGKAGVEVDNFMLFEVVQEGAVRHRFAVGFHEGLTANGQEVENVGKNGMRFEPREVELTGALPEGGAPFQLRVTVLDTGNVGRVSDVWLIFGGSPGEDGEGWRD